MIYVTGDIHGDADRLSRSALRRLRKGDTLLICGDFGFLWDGSDREKKFLRELGKRPYTVAFLDGRHENFDLLAQYPETEWNGGRAQVISGNLIHLMRGEIYTVEDRSFFVLGGGESDDREFRVPGVSWWEAEMPSLEELTRARANLAARGDRVDYILTHVPPAKSAKRLWTGGDTDSVSLFLDTLEDSVSCKGWFFASLHIDKRISAQRRALFREIVAVEDAP